MSQIFNFIRSEKNDTRRFQLICLTFLSKSIMAPPPKKKKPLRDLDYKPFLVYCMKLFIANFLICSWHYEQSFLQSNMWIIILFVQKSSKKNCWAKINAVLMLSDYRVIFPIHIIRVCSSIIFGSNL